MAREGDGGAPTLTGCQEVRSPFRSQRGFVGRIGVRRPKKGSKWRLWREHATYVQRRNSCINMQLWPKSRPTRIKQKQTQSNILQ